MEDIRYIIENEGIDTQDVWEEMDEDDAADLPEEWAEEWLDNGETEDWKE